MQFALSPGSRLFDPFQNVFPLSTFVKSIENDIYIIEGFENKKKSDLQGFYRRLSIAIVARLVEFR
jgi:hypothetical protein